MTTNRTLVAALLSLAVAGCGGGGGSSSSPAPVAGAPSPAPTPAPSPGPAPAPAPAGLSVVSTTPVAGAAAVARTSPITFTLNDAPLASTLPATQPNSVQLLTPEGVNLLTGVTVSGDAVTIANSGLALAGNTTYDVKLAASISNAAGNTLASPFSWSFTTAGENWAASGTNISTDNGFAVASTIPVMATDPSGNVFAAWIDSGNSGPTIAVQMFNAATNSWNGATTTVFSSILGSLGSLHMAAVPGAEPILTWVGLTDQSGDLGIYLSTFQLTGAAAGTWSAPVITPLDPGSYTPTGVSLVSSGRLLTIASRMEFAPQPGIYVAQYDQLANTWNATSIFAADATSPLRENGVATAVDATGNVTVAWVSGNSVGAHLYSATKAAASSTWSAPQQIDTLTSGTIDSIALGAGIGGTTLSWSQTSGSTPPTVQVSQLSSDQTTWSPPHQLDDGSSPTGAMHSTIAIDNAGFVDVSYTQTNTSNTVAATDGVFLTRFDPTTSTWSGPIRMSTAGAGISSSAVAIAVDNAGNVQLFYQVGGSVAPAIYYVSNGTVVDDGVIDDPGNVPSGLASVPAVIFGRDNVATAAWVKFEPAGYFIRADRKQ